MFRNGKIGRKATLEQAHTLARITALVEYASIYQGLEELCTPQGTSSLLSDQLLGYTPWSESDASRQPAVIGTYEAKFEVFLAAWTDQMLPEFVWEKIHVEGRLRPANILELIAFTKAFQADQWPFFSLVGSYKGGSYEQDNRVGSLYPVAECDPFAAARRHIRLAGLPNFYKEKNLFFLLVQK